MDKNLREKWRSGGGPGVFLARTETPNTAVGPLVGLLHGVPRFAPNASWWARRSASRALCWWMHGGTSLFFRVELSELS